MKYYRVKTESDNHRIMKKDKNGYLYFDGILIGGELYTEKEYKKLLSSVYGITENNNIFEEVHINKNNTHFFFGARFENKENV